MTQKRHTGTRLIFVLALLILPIMLMGCACAAPPVLQTLQARSLEIIAPSFEEIPQSESFEFYWHVLNVSYLLTKTTTTCTYHLYSKYAEGEHIAVNTLPSFKLGRDFEVEIGGANFTSLGEYCHLIECNTTGQTGAIERCFIVTENGKPTADVDVSVIFGLACLAFIFLTIAYIWNAKQIFMKSLFVIFALFIGVVISQTIYNAAKYQLAINDSIKALATTNTVMIAIVLLMILFLSINLLVTLFKSFKTMKKNKKERNANEIV